MNTMDIYVFVLGGVSLSKYFIVTLIGLATGVIGTGLGGALALLTNKKSNKFLSFILEFSAGLMIAVVCFDLLPEAFLLSGLGWGIFGIILGVGATIFADNYIRSLKYIKKIKGTGANLIKTGILMCAGIALHNLPEGIAIGSGFDASFTLGINLALVIGIHDIPEGLALAVPMRAGGLSKFKIISYSAIAGMPMGVGAFIGALLGEISSGVISVCLGFAGGAMLYIVCGDLIPESKNIYKGRMSTIGNISGIIVGIIISLGTH